jgi:hypothetical protein
MHGFGVNQYLLEVGTGNISMTIPCSQVMCTSLMLSFDIMHLPACKAAMSRLPQPDPPPRSVDQVLANPCLALFRRYHDRPMAYINALRSAALPSPYSVLRVAYLWRASPRTDSPSGAEFERAAGRQAKTVQFSRGTSDSNGDGPAPDPSDSRWKRYPREGKAER